MSCSGAVGAGMGGMGAGAWAELDCVPSGTVSSVRTVHSSASLPLSLVSCNRGKSRCVICLLKVLPGYNSMQHFEFLTKTVYM